MPEPAHVQEAHGGGHDEDHHEIRWRASRRSTARGDGVEVAPLPDGGMAVRDAGHRDGAVLVYTRAEVTAFLLGAKDGDFDDLMAEGA